MDISFHCRIAGSEYHPYTNLTRRKSSARFAASHRRTEQRAAIPIAGAAIPTGPWHTLKNRHTPNAVRETVTPTLSAQAVISLARSAGEFSGVRDRRFSQPMSRFSS